MNETKINPAFRSDTALKRVHLLQQTYSKNANSAQAKFFELRLLILRLTTLAAFLAVAHGELEKYFAETNHQIVVIVGYFLIIVPIFTSVLIAGAIKLDKGSNWILLRGASEALKKEMYLYRTQVGEYEKDRASKLVDRVKLICERFKGSPIHKSCLDPNENELEEISKKDKKDLSSSLSSEEYISERLNSAFSYYRKNSKKLSKSLQLYQWSIYLLGGLSTLLATTGLQAWVAVSSCLIGTVSSFLELKRIEATLVGYNQAGDDLYNINVFWDSLDDETRKKPDNIKKLVETTERAIQSENNSWLQDMQDKLKELYGVDNKDTKN